jgi:DNA invertase Pin-like site-specific DNA recombinase
MKAVAYLRTSSATNVGEDKDSHRRQADAIERYAARADLDIVASFYDAAASGTDPLDSRPGFGALLDRIEGNGVRTVVVEDASRFARDLLTQELGILTLIQRGVTVLTSTGEDLTQTDDPMKTAMRQIAGAFSQLEKARLVAKLRSGRERKRLVTGRCEGRKGHAEARPDTVALAKRLHRRSPKTGERRSLRTIAVELAAAGHLNEAGKAFHPQSVKAMVGG